jgi:hypothetical protein
VHIEIGPISDELVNEERPFYFGIGSDALSSYYYPFTLIAINIVVFEMVLLFKKRLPKTSKLYKSLDVSRDKIYFGFIVSLMVLVILPWKYVVFGGVANFRSKINSACQLLLYVFIVYFIEISFI